MKRIFTNEWLRDQIEKEPDNMECEAGFPLWSGEPLKQFAGSQQGPQEKTSAAESK